MLTHDCFFQRAPKIKTNLISRQSSDYNLRRQAQNPLDLKIPNLKSRAACNSFSVKAPVHWNNTHIELRQIEQKPLFERKKKRFSIDMIIKLIVIILDAKIENTMLNAT